MPYLIHAGLLLALCFAYYWLALRTETHFTLNRWVLLGGLAGSLLLPLLTVPAVLASSFGREIPSSSVGRILPDEVISLPEASASSVGRMEEGNQSSIRPTAPLTPSAGSHPTETDWGKWLWWGYLSGVLIFGFNFLLQLGQLLIRMLRNPGHDLGGFRLVEMREDEAPFSFWNRIFLNPDRYDPDTFDQIVQHERIHVTQRHSLDLLLAEAVVIVQWFNPFAWLYRKAIEHNLEYLTDAEMLRGGNDPETYQLSLVKVTVPNFPNGLVASYNQSFLEKRITMMKTRKSSLRSGWKYLTILPLLLLSVLQFNAVAQGVNSQTVTESDSQTVEQPTIDNASITETELAVETVSVPASSTDAAPAAAPESTSEVNSSAVTDMNSWTALIEGSGICFQFMSRSNAFNNRHNYQSSRCFAVSDFGQLPRNNMGTFSLQRTAGTMNFKGVFEGNDGVGNFTFVPATDFTARLKAAGFGNYEDREMMLLFMADINDEYLAYLKAQGYNAGHDKLIELSIFYDDLDELKTRISELERMGFRKPSLQKLIELQIHGVSEQYARELKASGFENLSLQDLIEARIHGVSADFLTAMTDAGFGDLNFDRAKEMAIHGIDEEYIREMSQLGYKNLKAEEIINAKIHGVNAAKIAEFREAGLTDLTLDEAKNLSIHGVSAEFVAELASFGFANLSAREITDAKIHGLSSRKLAELKSTGLPISNLNEVKNASIHGVSAEYIAGMRAIGYKDLDMDDFVQARIHGITPEWAASFREVGFKDIPFKTLLNLRIHGVTAEFISKRKKDGRTLKDYINMRIHGL